jgi:hypothetical protein
MGHQVKLLPGKAVKGFVIGNKNDRQDARAIWTAVQQPHVKAVALKTEEQQADPSAAPHEEPIGQVPYRPDQRAEGIAY